MAQSKAETVDGYLAELPEDRRAAISAVRQVVLENLPQGYEEMMQFGMIGYVIPLERYPVPYNGQALQYAALASQKNYMSLYLKNATATKRWKDGSLTGTKTAGKDWTWARHVSGLKACKICR